MSLNLFTFPISATETLNEQSIQQQDRLDQIDELISLAGKAARSGDAKSAQYYDSLLESMGVACVYANDVNEALAAFGLVETVETSDISSTNSNVDIPETTTTVRWYCYEANNYYYPQTMRYFDLIVMQAEPRNSGSHMRTAFDHTTSLSSSDSVSSLPNIPASLAVSILEHTIEGTPLGTLYTIADLISDAENYPNFPSSYTSFGINSATIHWTSDATYRYFYVREVGEEYYDLSMIESKLTADYDTYYRLEVFYTEYDSNFDEEITHTENKEYKNNSTQYGLYSYACAAYIQGYQLINVVDEVVITVCDHDVAIPIASVPVRPDAVYLLPPEGDEIT